MLQGLGRLYYIATKLLISIITVNSKDGYDKVVVVGTD